MHQGVVYMTREPADEVVPAAVRLLRDNDDDIALPGLNSSGISEAIEATTPARTIRGTGSPAPRGYSGGSGCRDVRP